METGDKRQLDDIFQLHCESNEKERNEGKIRKDVKQELSVEKLENDPLSCSLKLDFVKMYLPRNKIVMKTLRSFFYDIIGRLVIAAPLTVLATRILYLQH